MSANKPRRRLGDSSIYLESDVFSDLTMCVNIQSMEARFRPDERAMLLATPGIGPGVIQRLEEAGIHSFAQMHALGVQGTVRHVCGHLGNTAWANRQRALMRALALGGMPSDC